MSSTNCQNLGDLFIRFWENYQVGGLTRMKGFVLPMLFAEHYRIRGSVA